MLFIGISPILLSSIPSKGMLYTATVVGCSVKLGLCHTFTEGCNKWKKIGDKLKQHAESEAHKESAYKYTKYTVDYKLTSKGFISSC